MSQTTKKINCNQKRLADNLAVVGQGLSANLFCLEFTDSENNDDDNYDEDYDSDDNDDLALADS